MTHETKMRRSRRPLTGALVAVAMGVGFGMSGGGADAQQRMTFLTSAPGGSWYPMAAGVVEIMNANIPETTWSLEGGAGFVNNVTLSQGGVDCAWVSTDGIHLSRAGEPPFEQAIDQSLFRAVVSLPVSESHWVVLANSGINSLGDLRGKRIAIGKRGSSSNARSYMMLEPYGIGEDDFRPEFLAEEHAAKALTDGRIDAFIEFISHPAPPVVELSSRADIKLLGMEPEKADQLRGKYPYMVPVTIPGGTYRGVDEDATGYGIPGSWLCLSTVPDDVVYQMTKLTFENKDALIRVHSAFEKLDVNLARELETATGHPLHPGAARYYKEIGLIN